MSTDESTQPMKRKKTESWWKEWAFGLVVLVTIVFVVTEYSTGRLLISTGVIDPLAVVKNDIEKYANVTVFSVKMPKDYVIIEYELISKFMWPNEIIHDENVLEMICALRRRGPIEHPLSFRGMGRFRDDYGKLVHRLSIFSTMRVSTMNRIGCDVGRDALDTDWKQLSTNYRSHPIPAGLKMDT